MAAEKNRSIYIASPITSEWMRNVGAGVIRYGLVLVIVWIGAMKFTAYEANGIQPLVANSPLLSWVYGVFSVQVFSIILGSAEIAVGILIALRALAPLASAIGSGLAALMFLGTMSFLISTPGWEASLGGFPALSVVPGQFLIKDVVLFGVALWTMGDAMQFLGEEGSPAPHASCESQRTPGPRIAASQ